jgi:hypothetical protein
VNEVTHFGQLIWQEIQAYLLAGREKQSEEAFCNLQKRK